MIMRIVSDGQTGANRTALDWAISRRIPHGGWCPKGRAAEDGIIAARYNLKEINCTHHHHHTHANVKHSDGTVIVTVSPTLTPESQAAVNFAAKLGKPWLHIHRHRYSPTSALSRFVAQYEIHVLNVSGSRASHEPEVGSFVHRILDDTFFYDPEVIFGEVDASLPHKE